MKKLLTFLILAYLSFTINSRAITHDKKKLESEKILNNQVIFFLKNVITFGTSDRNATNYFMY